LLRLWREERSEAEPEDVSATNLIVQLGLVTELLNRHWFERNPPRDLSQTIQIWPVIFDVLTMER
jgi:hypothetical protein